MMANGHANPRLMLSSLLRSCTKIIRNPITKRAILSCRRVAVSIEFLRRGVFLTDPKKGLSFQSSGAPGGWKQVLQKSKQTAPHLLSSSFLRETVQVRYSPGIPLRMQCRRDEPARSGRQCLRYADYGIPVIVHTAVEPGNRSGDEIHFSRHRCIQGVAGVREPVIP